MLAVVVENAGGTRTGRGFSVGMVGSRAGGHAYGMGEGGAFPPRGSFGTTGESSIKTLLG